MTVNEILDLGLMVPKKKLKITGLALYPFQRLTVSNGTILPCTGAHNEEEGLVLEDIMGRLLKK